MEDYRYEELDKQLKEKFPDLNIVIQYYSTGNNAAKLKAEGKKTEADIVLGLETASIKQVADNLADLSGFKQDQYLPDAKSEDARFFTWEKYEGGIIVNTKVLEDKGLAEPKSYDDLLKDEYKGQIVMPNPKTSGTGYMFLNTWVNHMGEDKAFEYVDKLQKNIMSFTESGSGPIKTLLQGDAAIGLGMVFQAAEQITEGAPLKVIQFPEGCPYNTTSFGIIEGKQSNDNVVKVFNFLNEEFIYYDAENFAPGMILVNQNNKIKNYPSDIKSADMTTITDDEYKQSLISKWKY